MKRLMPIFLLIALFIIFSLTTYKEYGITSDEFSSYISGQIWLEYFQNIPITNNLVRYHPLVNEHYRLYPMVLFAIVSSLKYELFHLLNMLAFVPLLIAAGVLSLYQNKKYYAGLIPLLFILINPRIIGDVANNPKDTPFAIVYFLALTGIFLIEEYKPQLNPHIKVIVLGLIFGLAQSLRPLGFSLYIVYFLWRILGKKENLKIQNILLESINIFLVGMLWMAVTWPAIGSNFFPNLKKYLSLGIDFNLWEGKVLYLGNLYDSNNLPWHYLFVWLAISLPLTHILFFITGLYSLVKRKTTKLQNLFYVVIFVNILLYFILKPNLYNGIRHYQFLVTIISFLAGINLVQHLKTLRKKASIALVGIYIIYTVNTLGIMYRIHPFENIYFNEITGGLRGATKLFDTDYWGTTYKVSSNFLNTLTVADRKVTIYACGARTAIDYYTENKFDQKKNPNDAEYIVCNAQEYAGLNTNHKVLLTVEKLGVPLIVISGR